MNEIEFRQNKEQYIQDLYEFVSEYVDTFRYPKELGKEQCCRDCVRLLVGSGTFTKDELKKIALKEKALIIPDDYFKKDDVPESYVGNI